MPGIESLLVTKAALFALVLARVGALTLTAPLLRIDTIPLQIRGLLAVALSMMVMPVVIDTPVAGGLNLVTFGKLILAETLVGVLLGLGLMVLLAGVQVTGQIVSQLSGMSLADVADPSFDSQSSVFTQLFSYLVLAVFVTLGGHRLLVEMLLGTYTLVPPGQAIVGEQAVEVLLQLLGQSFELGLRASAPLMLALLLATIVLGLVSRTLPQLNVIAVGFSLNAVVTLSIAMVSLGGIAWTFQESIAAAADSLVQAVGDDGATLTADPTSPGADR